MPDVISLVALSLTCLNGCIKGLVLLSKAKHYSRDVSDVRLRTELTLHSLTTWAEEAGLMEEPPTLLMSASNAALVPEILGQLEKLFLDLTQLKQRYGLYLQPTLENVEALYDDDKTLDGATHQKHEYSKRAVSIFHKRREPWKRLRWVTLDDKRFDSLLDKAKSYINEIEKFLEQAKQERRDRYLELCFRDAILNTSGQQELGIIGAEYGKAPSKLAIAGAARFKQTRLMLGFSESTSTSSTATLPQSLSIGSIHGKKRDCTTAGTPSVEQKDMKLSMRLLTLSRVARARPLRTLAQYDGRVVLLEWKNVGSMTDPTISERVNQVAILLQGLGPTFNSLRCRGFVRDHIVRRYGYVFGLPSELDFSAHACSSVASGIFFAQQKPELRSLREMLDKTSVPSLNMRLSIAIKLLETLLNLHTSGWLHKEFRSENIIFIRGKEHSRQESREDLSTYSVFIAGYVYSRVDNPSEMTEPLESELEPDLYRHPSILCDSRQSYRKSLDIFSVGRTLLEIGLWSSFRHMLEHHSQAHSDTPAPFMSVRSASDPTQVRSNAFEQNKDKSESEQNPPSHLMRLKYDLLLSHLTTHGSKHISPRSSNRSMILASLEAAMGRRYTDIVEEFLTAANQISEIKANEHKFALDLEMRARDTIRAIAEAI